MPVPVLDSWIGGDLNRHRKKTRRSKTQGGEPVGGRAPNTHKVRVRKESSSIGTDGQCSCLTRPGQPAAGRSSTSAGSTPPLCSTDVHLQFARFCFSKARCELCQ
jgi:hypothetical protein